MKLLFDQNLSPSLCARLANCFHTAEHVRDHGLREASDGAIWEYAARGNYAIVSKDSDFRQRSFLEGHPPRIIWVRLGNCSTDAVERPLRSRSEEIAEFLADESKSFLVLS